MVSEIAVQQSPAIMAGHLRIALPDSAGAALIAAIGTGLGHRPDSLAASRGGRVAAPVEPPARAYPRSRCPRWAHGQLRSALAGFRAFAVDPQFGARSPA
jgi:hypothetical protein